VCGYHIPWTTRCDMSCAVKCSHGPRWFPRHPHGWVVGTFSCERATKQLCPALPCASPQLAEERKRLAVFVSGGGSNFKQIHKGCREGAINGDILVS
jgi:hypothetical protein